MSGRRWRKDQVRGSEERYHWLIENMPVGFCVIDRDGFISFVNPRLAEMLGYTIDEMRGRPFFSFVDEGCTDSARRCLERCRRGATERHEFELVRKDGTRVYTSLSVAPATDDNGAYLGAVACVVDITDRKQVEEEYRKTRERFRGIYNSSKDAMGFVSLDGVLLDVNDSFCQLTGYSREALLNKRKYQDVTPAEYHENEARIIETILRTGQPAEYEKEYIRKDGSRVPILLTTFVVKGFDGNPIGLAAMIKDIGERKQAEEQLRQSEKRYRDLADSLPQVVFELDASGNVTFANARAFRSFGYTQDDLAKGLNVAQLVIPENLDKARERIQRILSGEELEPAEYTARRKDGSTFPFLVYSSPIRQANRVVGLRGIVIDITRLKRDEQALRESQRRYRDLFDYASDAIIVRDLEGNVIEANRAATALTGYTPDELMKMNISQLLAPESLPLTIESQQVLLKGEATSQRYELELVKKDGSRRFAESVTRTIIKDGQPVGIQAMVRDVTEQRRLRESMQFYISGITKAQEEERKRIARELHDETAQSLAALLLDIQAISRAGDRLSDETLRRLEELRTDANSILEGVRRFSHELRPDVLDQLGLLPALELLTGELNKEKAVSTSIEVSGSERRLRPEAELALFRVGQEALRNVRKHSQATEAVVRVVFAQNRMKLTVTDNGCGFELSGALGDLVSKGKLGLAGMQERARLLGGSLSVRSQPGKGTTVTVEIAA